MTFHIPVAVIIQAVESTTRSVSVTKNVFSVVRIYYLKVKIQLFKFFRLNMTNHGKIQPMEGWIPARIPRARNRLKINGARTRNSVV